MLNGKQKSYLRGLAQTRNAVFQIGKDGLSDNLIDVTSAYLKKNELVKITVLKSCPADIEETAFDLAMHTNSELIQIIGRQIVLYKKARETKILLP